MKGRWYITFGLLISSIWVMAQHGSSCYDPISFQWDSVYVQEAGTTQWYRVQLNPSQHRNKEFVLELTNLTDAGTRVQATPYFSCGTDPIADESNTLLAYQTKTTRMEAGLVNYVLDTSGGLVMLKLTTTGTIEFSSTVQTPIEQPQNPACLSAEPIYPTSYYTLRTTGQNWFTYPFSGSNYLTWVFHPNDTNEVVTKRVAFYESCDADAAYTYVTDTNVYDKIQVPTEGQYYIQIETSGEGYIEFLCDTLEDGCAQAQAVVAGNAYMVQDSALFSYQPSDAAFTDFHVAEQAHLLLQKGYCGDGLELLMDTVVTDTLLSAGILPALPAGQAYFITIKGTTGFMIENHGGDCRTAYEIVADTTTFHLGTLPTWFAFTSNGSQTVDLYFEPDDATVTNSKKTVELYLDCDSAATISVSRNIDVVNGFFIIPEGRYYVKYTGTTEGTGTCVVRDTLVHKHHYVDTTFCEGDELLIADTVFTQSGEYIDVVIRNNGYFYDIYHYTIHMKPARKAYDYLLVDVSELPLVMQGVTIDTAGVYELHYPLEEGCDSLVYLTVLVNGDVETEDTLTIVDVAFDTPYLLKDSSQVFRLFYDSQPDSLHVVWETGQEAGDILPEVQVSYGSPKGLVLQKGLPSPENGVFAIEKLWQDIAYYQKDTLFVRVFNSTWGSVTFKPITYQYDTVDVSICEGSAYELPDTLLYVPGVYTDTLKSADGYRYTITHYQVEVIPAPQTYDTLQLNETELPFQYGDTLIEGAGIYTLTYKTLEGCDSLVHVRVYVEKEEPEQPDEQEKTYDSPVLFPTMAKAGTPLTLYLPDKLRVWSIKLYDVSGRLMQVWNMKEDTDEPMISLIVYGSGYHIMRVETSLYSWQTPLILY